MVYKGITLTGAKGQTAAEEDEKMLSISLSDNEEELGAEGENQESKEPPKPKKAS